MPYNNTQMLFKSRGKSLSIVLFTTTTNDDIFFHFGLDFSTFSASHEQLIDIKSLLFISGFKEESVEGEELSRRGALILIPKASDFLVRVRSGVLLSSIKIQ